MPKRKQGAVAWGAQSPKRKQAADAADHHQGDFGKYMSDKVRKLGDQFKADASKSNDDITFENAQDKLLEGISIYVNGYTTPSHQDLRLLMANHGGNFENYFSKSRVTHIICSNLANSKLKEFRSFSKGLPVVKPDWLVDSIAAGQVLPCAKYQLQLGTPQQRKLSSFFGSESRSGRDESMSGMSTASTKMDVEITSNPTDLNEEQDRSDQAEAGPHSEPELQIEEPVQDEETSEPEDPIVEEKHGFSLRSGHTSHSTLGDANFVQNYFKYSRLHFIGTWRNRYQKKHRVAPKLGCERSTIIHIDMDCFFVAVVTRKHPEMAGKPVAVCHSDSSKGTAEISSANYEARSYGVKAGMFVRDAKACCPMLTIVPYDFEGYEQVAGKLYDILHQHSPIVQAVSCDEAFIDVTGAGDPCELASKIRQQIFESTQCTASAGISGNILLARLATKMAKPNGQYHIQPDQAEQVMAPLRVEELPGVGRSLRDKLHRLRILTCSDLSAVKMETLRQEFGTKTGEMLWNYARGIDHRQLKPAQERKSIGAEVNWGVRFLTSDDAARFLVTLSEEVSARLKGAAVLGRTFTLKVRKRKSGAGEPVKFMGCGICDNISRSATLASNTDDANVILRVSRQLLTSLNIAVQEIRGLGLQVTRLESGIQGQRSLASCFESSPSKKTPQDAETRRKRKREDSPPPAQDAQAANNRSGNGLPPASELDYSVLRSLPPEVFAEINQAYSGALNLGNAEGASTSKRENVTGSRSRDHAMSSRDASAIAEAAKTIYVPPLSQIDMTIVGELPTQLRKEVMGACNDSNEAPPPNSNEAPPNPKPDFNNLWSESPPNWVQQFQNSECKLLRSLSNYYTSEGCPMKFSQFLLKFNAYTDYLGTEGFGMFIDECSHLISQYFELRLPIDMEEVVATTRILRRMGKNRCFWTEILDRIVPLIQDHALRLYGGYLKLSSNL